MADELEKGNSKVRLNLLGLASPRLLIQAISKICFKKYFGIFSYTSKFLVRWRLFVLLVLVLSQIIIGCFLVYPKVISSTSDVKLSVYNLDNTIDIVTNVNSQQRTFHSESVDRTIFVITPTYKRDTQKVDLTTLNQALSLVENIVWIVVEDSDSPSKMVSNLLSRSRVKSIHLTMRTPEDQVVRSSWWRWLSRQHRPHRGVAQRNVALSWLRKEYQSYSKYGCDGVVYFADDDNRYDIEIFEIMRETRKLSVWPVGFRGGLTYEGPVCKDLRLLSWRKCKTEDTEINKMRAFPVDMAGFAVNLCQIISHPSTKFEASVPHGHLENAFILQFISNQEEAECRGSDKEVLAWHVKTKLPNLKSEPFEPAEYKLLT